VKLASECLVLLCRPTWKIDGEIKLKIKIEEMCQNIENDRYFIYHRYDNDIWKKTILKTPIRYDTDIIDDTDAIDSSLLWEK